LHEVQETFLPIQAMYEQLAHFVQNIPSEHHPMKSVHFASWGAKTCGKDSTDITEVL